jgi:superfamily II DNA or RNA helicase
VSQAGTPGAGGPVEELFEAVREAASAQAWSRGVELARAGAVHGEREAAGELLLRVATRGGLLSPAVLLEPAKLAWDCDCGTREDACEHAAAAVIALRRARAAGKSLPGAEREPGRIGYRLSCEGGGLAIERAVVTPAGETLLTATLAALASGRVAGPEFVATQADLAIEQILGSKTRGRVPRGVLPALIARLAECADVTLDGAPIRAAAQPLAWRAELDDENTGFRLRVRREAPLDVVFDEVAALAGGMLRPLAATPLSGRELEELGRGGRRFEAGEAARLVTEVLPDLTSRIPVEIKTGRLPRAVREPPRIQVQTSRRGDALEVLAALVYGDPPLARVDAGGLTPLGSGPVPLRDEAAERVLLRRLQTQLEILPGRRVSLEGEAAVALAERLRSFAGEVTGGAHQAFFRAPVLEPSVEAGAEDFSVSFSSEVEGRRRHADPDRVLRAWRAGESLVPLEAGGFAPLPADWLARFGDRLSDLLAARETAGTLPRACLPELGELCGELGLPEPPGLDALRPLFDAQGTLRAAALPADLRAELRGYQRRGVDWLCALRDAGLGALLADDMGLGKTLQALCAIRGRTLVVCPTSVLHGWKQEIERFRPALSASLYHGPSRALDPQADVTLTSYAILRLDADTLCAERWDTAILDEAQNVKNPDSQAARTAFRLDAGFRVAMTGTPVENRLDELWSQLHFANPGLLGSRRDFDERLARNIAAGDAEAAARLRARIRPFVLRRLKRDVAPELPPRTDILLRAELTEEERRLYEAIRAATREDVVRQLEAGGSVLAALEALLRLRQAACHPALVPGQASATSSKLEVLLEELDEAVAEGHKALVFSQWTSFLDLVEPHLARAGIEFARLDGSTRDRAGVVAHFQAETGPPVLIASLTAGGVGLNLTAADHVFLLDPWWNPAVEDQAADRAHRIGQDRPVMVHRIVARDTVEERILALQARKRELAEAALGSGLAAAALTRDDLLALLD